MTRAPFARGSVTSQTAAALMEPALPALEQKVLDYLDRHGPKADWQMQADLRMSGDTQRPRRKFLEDHGYVIKVGFGKTPRNKPCVLFDVNRQGSTQGSLL